MTDSLASAGNPCPTSVSRVLGGLSRGELLLLVLLLATVNGLFPIIVTGVVRDGWMVALANTLDVNVIVWIGLWLGAALALEDPAGPVRRVDVPVAVLAAAACLLPLGPATFVVLTAVALYTLWTSPAESGLRRAGWVFLAITVPLFWSKRVFNLFSEFFLGIDALLVSRITGTERTDNLVAIPGGEGFLQIAAPCSSMANVSLAVLCWVLATQYVGLKWRPSNLLWCGAACLAVVAINVTRISLIGFFPHYYEVLHGGIGNTIVGWISTACVFAICYLGVTRGRVSAV